MLLFLAIAGLAAAPVAEPRNLAPPAVVATASGLRIQTLVAGTGAQPQPADSVAVTYEGRLADGTVFDAQAEPVVFPVSALVPGFTEALLAMKKGGKYRFWIPPQLGYGAEGAGGVIPPNAELDFTVTLVDVIPAADSPQPQQG